MRPLVAHCHLGLGALYARTGRREPAAAHLGIAAASDREPGMAGWLAQALGVSNGPAQVTPVLRHRPPLR